MRQTHEREPQLETEKFSVSPLAIQEKELGGTREVSRDIEKPLTSGGPGLPKSLPKSLRVGNTWEERQPHPYNLGHALGLDS